MASIVSVTEILKKNFRAALCSGFASLQYFFECHDITCKQMIN